MRRSHPRDPLSAEPPPLRELAGPCSYTNALSAAALRRRGARGANPPDPSMPLTDETERTLSLAEFAANLLEQTRTNEARERRYHHVAGVRGAGAPLLARFASHALGRPLLYVTPDAESAEAAARDLRYLLGEPRLGLGEAKAGSKSATPSLHSLHPVQLLLPSESSPYEQVHPDRRAAMRRSSTLAALASGQPFSFLVTSAAALLRRVVPPEPLRAASIELRRELEVDLRDVANRLTRAGYLRNPVVEDPGCVAVRGGLLDVWPPQESAPVRIELSGDTISSLRRF